jgi:small-conductance mechanosensitive channel
MLLRDVEDEAAAYSKMVRSIDDQVTALMREAASRPRRILTSPAPNVLILSFRESAIELEMRFWIADAQHGVDNVKSEVLYEVWRLFRQEGIQIPYVLTVPPNLSCPKMRPSQVVRIGPHGPERSF